MKRKVVLLMLLTIALPVGLLTSFRLTGIVPNTAIAETITLKAASWKIERPSEFVRIYSVKESNYTDAEIAVSTSVEVYYYNENDRVAPFNGWDGLDFQANLNVTAFQGRLTSLVIRFDPSDSNITIFLDTYFSGVFFPPYNAKLTYLRDTGTCTSEALMVARATATSSGLKMIARAVFMDENVDDHLLNVAFEVTYFNGTAYRKIVAPTVLEVLIGNA